MSIQERLQLILKMHNLSPSTFADQIGVQRSNVSHVLSGRNKPGLDFLEKIIKQYPRVNAHWLISGKMPISHLDPTTVEVSSKSVEDQIELTEIGPGYVIKIVEYYNDGTFKEFFPKK